MQYLLDTHTFLWSISGDARLGKNAREVISNPNSKLFFSLASYWEICIKISLGKLKLKDGWPEILDREMQNLGILKLNIHKAHLLGLGTIPFHHRDPFDRLLICQARTENLTFITADENIRKYEVPCLF